MNIWLKEHEYVAVWIGVVLGAIPVIPTVIGWCRNNPVLRSPYLWVMSLFALGFEVYLSLGGEFSRGVNIFGNFAIAILSLVMGLELKREGDAVRRARERREKRQRQKWKYWH